MPQSLSGILVHIVFSTKNRQDFLDENICGELYLYLASLLKNKNCKPYKIGGIANHIHILCALGKVYSVSKIIEEMKSSTSKWIKSKNHKFKSFAWQNGYGAFSISPSHFKKVYSYIENQKQHHEKTDFKNEFLQLLDKYKIPYNNQYLWN